MWFIFTRIRDSRKNDSLFTHFNWMKHFFPAGKIVSTRTLCRHLNEISAPRSSSRPAGAARPKQQTHLELSNLSGDCSTRQIP